MLENRESGEMAFALSISHSSMALLFPSSSSYKDLALMVSLRPVNLLLSRQRCSPPPPLLSTVAFARRRSNRGSVSTSDSSKERKAKKEKGGFEEKDDFEGDPFEALFRQLEEDLKNDKDGDDDGDGVDSIKEEDIERLATELAEAFRDLDDDEEDDDDGESDVKHDEDDEDEEEVPVKLKNWQLRRLAYALKAGRRKTSIKTLAAELCLDRPVVLALLRDPPPNLLMMSATLPDEPPSTLLVPEAKPTESVQAAMDDVKDKSKVKEPVHVMQRRWSAQKRLKKVQIETLERVYQRSKRPTNAIISSIVQVTNLPRKRIVKWFEDKRNEDGVPAQRTAYHRSTSGTVFSQ